MIDGWGGPSIGSLRSEIWIAQQCSHAPRKRAVHLKWNKIFFGEREKKNLETRESGCCIKILFSAFFFSHLTHTQSDRACVLGPLVIRRVKKSQHHLNALLLLLLFLCLWGKLRLIIMQLWMPSLNYFWRGQYISQEEEKEEEGKRGIK